MSNIQKIRVGGVPEHFNLPWHNAIDGDAFASSDIVVEFVEYPGGTGAMTGAMEAGHLDVALLLFEGAVTNILRGHANRIVKVYVQSPLIWGIHVAADSNIETVDQIQDAVFAISRAGSGSHLIAIVDAAERGWPTDQIKFSKVRNLAGAREKLASGLVDVFLWERFTTQPLVDSGEFRRIGERIVPWPAFVVSVRESFLRGHENKLHEMLTIVNAHCREVNQDSYTPQIVSEKFDIKRIDAVKWFEHVQWNYEFDCPADTIGTIIEYLERVQIVETTGATAADVWQRLPSSFSSY